MIGSGGLWYFGNNVPEYFMINRHTLSLSHCWELRTSNDATLHFLSFIKGTKKYGI